MDNKRPSTIQQTLSSPEIKNDKNKDKRKSVDLMSLFKNEKKENPNNNNTTVISPPTTTTTTISKEELKKENKRKLKEDKQREKDAKEDERVKQKQKEKEDKQTIKELEKQLELERQRLKQKEKDDKSIIKEMERQLEEKKNKKKDKSTTTTTSSSTITPSTSTTSITSFSNNNNRPPLLTVPSSSSINSDYQQYSTHSEPNFTNEYTDLGYISASYNNGSSNISSHTTTSSSIFYPNTNLLLSTGGGNGNSYNSSSINSAGAAEQLKKEKKRSSIGDFISRKLIHSNSSTDLTNNNSNNNNLLSPNSNNKGKFPLGQHRSSLDIKEIRTKNSSLSENDITDESDNSTVSTNNTATNPPTFLEVVPIIITNNNYIINNTISSSSPTQSPTTSTFQNNNVSSSSKSHSTPTSPTLHSVIHQRNASSTSTTTTTNITNNSDSNTTSSSSPTQPSIHNNNNTNVLSNSNEFSQETLIRSSAFKRKLEFFYEKILAAEVSGSRYNPLDDKRKTNQNKSIVDLFLKNKKGPFGMKNIQYLLDDNNIGGHDNSTINHKRSYSTSVVPPDLQRNFVNNNNNNHNNNNLESNENNSNIDKKNRKSLFKRTLNPNRLSLTLGRNLDREREHNNNHNNNNSGFISKPFDKILQFDGSSKLKKLQSSVKGFLNVDIPSYGKKKKNQTQTQREIDDLIVDLEESEINSNNSGNGVRSLDSSTSSYIPPNGKSISGDHHHHSISKLYIERLQLQKKKIYLCELKTLVSRLEMNIIINSNKLSDLKTLSHNLTCQMDKTNMELKECSDISKVHIYSCQENQFDIETRIEKYKPSLDGSVACINKFYDKSKVLEDNVQILRRRTFGKNKKNNNPIQNFLYKLFLITYFILIFKFIFQKCEKLFQKLDSNINNNNINNNIKNSKNNRDSGTTIGNPQDQLLLKNEKLNLNPSSTINNLNNNNINTNINNINNNNNSNTTVKVDQKELMKTAKSNLDKLTKTISLMREVDGNIEADDEYDD